MKTLTASLVLVAAMPLAAWAQPGDLTVRRHVLPEAADRAAPQASEVEIPIDPTGWVRIQTPFAEVQSPDGPVLVRVPHYQGPDGTYDTAADLTNAINGVPCGVDCTARALERWGYRP